MYGVSGFSCFLFLVLLHRGLLRKDGLFHGICPMVCSMLERFPHAADKNLHILPDGWNILGISEISCYLWHNLVGKLCYCYSYGNAKVEESNSSHPLVIPVYTGPFRSISIYFMK